MPVQRKKREPVLPTLSPDQQRAFERLLKIKGVEAEQFLAFLLRGENRALVELLLARVAAEVPKAKPKAVPKVGLPSVITIPLILISQQQIGSLEAICQHLRDTRALSYTQIAALLNRDPRTIWASSKAADRQTAKEPLQIVAGDFSVPVSIFADRRLSILESVVVHLREDLGYKPYQIAQMLQRDQRVIATTWQRVLKKRKPGNTDTEVGK